MDLLHLLPVIFRVDGGGETIGGAGFVSLSPSLMDKEGIGVKVDGRWRRGGSESVLEQQDLVIKLHNEDMDFV